MLYTIPVVLSLPWVFGLVGSHTLGGVIQAVVVIGIITVVVNFLTSRRRI